MHMRELLNCSKFVKIYHCNQEHGGPQKKKKFIVSLIKIISVAACKLATSIHEKHENPLKSENRALLLPVIPSKKDENSPSHVAPIYEILYGQKKEVNINLQPLDK